MKSKGEIILNNDKFVIVECNNTQGTRYYKYNKTSGKKYINRKPIRACKVIDYFKKGVCN